MGGKTQAQILYKSAGHPCNQRAISPDSPDQSVHALLWIKTYTSVSCIFWVIVTSPRNWICPVLQFFYDVYLPNTCVPFLTSCSGNCHSSLGRSLRRPSWRPEFRSLTPIEVLGVMVGIYDPTDGLGLRQVASGYSLPSSLAPGSMRLCMNKPSQWAPGSMRPCMNKTECHATEEDIQHWLLSSTYMPTNTHPHHKHAYAWAHKQPLQHTNENSRSF